MFCQVASFANSDKLKWNVLSFILSKSYVKIETEPCPFLLKKITLGDNSKDGEEQLKSK